MPGGKENGMLERLSSGITGTIGPGIETLLRMD